MPAPPLNVAPLGRATLPDTGIGRGWEGPFLLVVSLLLFAFGLVNLYSASAVLAQQSGAPDYHFVLRQALGGALGLVVLVACSRVPYRWWQRLAWPALAACLVLLVVLVLPGTQGVAPEIKGARRWLHLPGFVLQPSEVAKVALVIWTAALAVKKQAYFSSLRRGLLPFLVVWGVVAGLVMAQPDFSTAFLLCMVGAVVVFAGGARPAHFLLALLVFLPFLVHELGEGYRLERIKTFLDPAAESRGEGYQVRQSLIALGSGGLAGMGFGEGRQKFGFLPEPHNDFIFAMIGEEWGWLGVTSMVGLYSVMILVGFRVARLAPDLFGELLAIGLTSLLALQALLHMGVNLGVVPPTGLALPFVSYGRSNLLASFAALGILLSVARAARAKEAPRG